MPLTQWLACCTGKHLIRPDAPRYQAFRTVETTLNACHSFTETANGTTASGTIGAMSFPTYGDESIAWTADITVEGVTAAQGLVLVKKGSLLTMLALGDTGQLDTTSLQQFTALVVNKLPN